jgi:hypothetical protein
MAKKAKSKKSASKTTRRKPAPAVVEATAEPDWDALEREQRESSARRAALIAAKDAQVSDMTAGCGRSAVRTELAPLHDALAMACIWSNALAQSMAQRRELPKSVALGRWAGQWATEYGSWWDAIKAARALAMSSVVAAIMDAGERRPTKKWTSQVVAQLDRFAATLHPIREGGSGLGFICAGAEFLPANFSALAEAIAARVVELQSVPQAESAAPERVVESEWDSADDAITFTDNERRLHKAMASQDGSHLWSSAALGDAAGVCNETARRFVVRMCEHGLAERPEGKRRGARLTTKGRRRANGKSAKPQD